MLLGIITFIESATQKILVLTLIYGLSFWEAINIYGKWVTDALRFISNLTASKLVIGTFIFVYAFLGMLFGFFIHRIIKRINEIESIEKYQLSVEKYQGNHSKKKSKQFRRLLLWLVTIVLIIISFSLLEEDLLGWGKAFYIIIRSITVLVIWIFIVSPLLMRLLKFILKKKKSRYQEEVDNALELFPYLKTIVVFSWKASKNTRGIRRISEFVTKCILYSMFFKVE